MLVGGRLYFCLILIWTSSLLLNTKGDILNGKERRKRHIFPLLGYLHGYKIGQNFALQLPSFVLSPVIIVPVNQQQSVNIQKSGTSESFQENGATFQTNLPVKLVLNSSLEDIGTDFETSLQNCTLHGHVNNNNDTFRQINVDTESFTENLSKTDDFMSTTGSFETTETEYSTTTKPITTAAISGLYPAPAYNNEKVNSLQLTTLSTESNLGLTSLVDTQQNVSSKMNQSKKVTSVTENMKNESLESASSRVISFRFTTERYYPRPNTRYYNPHSFWHNGMVDQFSITTNSYREEEKESPLPPRYDDRWRRFSSLSKVVLPASGFKPLAGLYYDGFLHKSLTKKTGFIPFDQYYD